MTNLSKQDYLFVKGENVDIEHQYGDMDRLKTSFNPSDTVRGVIMPHRRGVTSTGVLGKNVLSGEDMCYLAEGAMERRLIMGPYPEPESTEVSFSRIVKAGDGTLENQEATPSWIAEALKWSIRDSDLFSGWVKDSPQDGSYDLPNDEVFSFYRTSDLSSRTSDFQSGCALVRANVDKLFLDEQMLSMFAQQAEDSGGNPNIELSERLYDQFNYNSQYPYIDDQGTGPLLHWSGGLHNSPSELPDHSYGGLYVRYYEYFFYYDLPSCIPDGLIFGPGEVWVNFDMSYLIREEGQSGDATRLKFCKRLGRWTRSGSRLWFRYDGSYIRDYILTRVANEKMGWFPSYNLPDEYGEKLLRINDLEDGGKLSSVWFTIPISHTKWWS